MPTPSKNNKPNRRGSDGSTDNGRSTGRVRTGGRSWGILRQAVAGTPTGPRRPTNLLNTMKMTNFRFSQRQGPPLPEEGGDLHNFFRTCASLTRIREELRNALSADEGKKLGFGLIFSHLRLVDGIREELRNALSADEGKKLGFGLNACARPEEDTGRLLLHSISLNDSIISSGGSAAAQSRVKHFILQELLQAYPSAIVEEDDKGYIPFMEPIAKWIQARRAIRKWKVETDLTREKVALVAAKLRKSAGAAAARTRDNDSDSEQSFGGSYHGSRDGRRLTAFGSSLHYFKKTVSGNDEKQA
eukprot:CAMPEP_0183747008 /NCGR_PEP_ID=MMETSP0737-20130205/67046_1 /TAXON_ID=385413 /ORGANISM="Thalassiosira miniscula, Strain CCMP1093" /LENGTH=301 /DNA_ID=CAMNT_0025982715 /DNA_START=300 /DNA_END=1202 /DNA_ORIENTATION=-